MIERLAAKHLRVLTQVDVEFSPGINLLVGASGSGKSSILEALHLLSTGHSHRTRRYKSVVKNGETQLFCHGDFSIDGIERSLGVSRDTKNQWQLRIDRAPQSKLSMLAGLFPFRVIAADSWRIVSGEPELRRNLMDWFLFHVEPDRYPLMRYRRVLAQRNRVLQSAGSEKLLEALDIELASTGEEINRYRQALCQGFRAPLISDPEVKIELKLGYKESLIEALAAARSADRKLRTTTRGPHRGDIVLSCFERPAKEVLSQGQLARTALALQLEFIAAMGVDKVAIGIDDIHAHLDRESLNQVLRRLTGYQIFLTETNLASADWASVADRVFHVKQGRVEAVV